MVPFSPLLSSLTNRLKKLSRRLGFYLQKYYCRCLLVLLFLLCLAAFLIFYRSAWQTAVSEKKPAPPAKINQQLYEKIIEKEKQKDRIIQEETVKNYRDVFR